MAQFRLHSFEFDSASGQTNGREKQAGAVPVTVRVTVDGACSDDLVQMDWVAEKKRQVQAYFRDLRVSDAPEHKRLWQLILSEHKFAVDSSELSTRKRLARVVVRVETNEQRVDRMIEEAKEAGLAPAEIAEYVRAELARGVEEKLAALAV